MAVALRAFRRAVDPRNESGYKPVRLAASFEVVKEAPADEPTLLDFAPIFGVKDDAAGIAFAQKMISTPNHIIAELQADDLAPVWAALEKADKDIAQVSEPGRADVPLEAGKLHALSLDVAKYLGIAQTQLPVIVSDIADHNEMMTRLTRTVGAKNLDCEFAFVIGAMKEPVSRIHLEEERQSRFGFMTVRSREPSKSKGIPYEEKLLALPVLTIDRQVLTYVTEQQGGEAMLRDLQHIVGIINHDYFHHLTARIVSPYFTGLKENTLDFQNTPFAQLLDGKLTSAEDFNKFIRPPYGDSLKAERQMPLYNEYYHKDKGTWSALFGKQTYEFHALHLHRRLYQDYLNAGPQGQEMRQRLDSLFATLKNLPPAPDRHEPHNIADITKIYFSGLVYSNLLRIVTHEHPLAQQCEKLIDDLGISPLLLKCEREARIERTDIGRFAEVDYISGVDKNALDTPGKQLRWQAYVMNARDTNYIHMKEWKEAQDKALPAMRFYLSAVQRDIQLAKWRGGPEALDATRDSVNRDKPEPV